MPAETWSCRNFAFFTNCGPPMGTGAGVAMDYVPSPAARVTKPKTSPGYTCGSVEQRVNGRSLAAGCQTERQNCLRGPRSSAGLSFWLLTSIFLFRCQGTFYQTP